jgi:hypothetical protein
MVDLHPRRRMLGIALVCSALFVAADDDRDTAAMAG